MNILIKPIITEKATNDSELNNRYTFQVNVKSNKVEIKKAVERGDSTLVFATSIQHAIILKILLDQPINHIHSECVFGDTNTHLRNKYISDLLSFLNDHKILHQTIR